MPVDLSAVAREARAAIDVPPVPFALRAAAREAAPETPRPRRSRLVAAVLAGLSLIAAATAAQVALHPQIVIQPSGAVVVQSDASTPRRHGPPLRRKPHAPWPAPTAEEVRAAARAMDFPVTLPAGVPGNRPPRALLRVGTSAMILSYDLPGAWRRDNHLLTIILANPAIVRNGGDAAAKKHAREVQVGSTNAARTWHVGGEDVIVLKSTMTPAETEQLHRATLAAAAAGRE